MTQPVSWAGNRVRGSRLLRLYSYYSLLLALVLMIVTGLDHTGSFVGTVRPLLMLSAASAYVVAAALFAAVANRRPDPQAAIGYVFVEIALLAAMMLASGGLDSGFANLLLIPLIISNLLAPGVLGFGVAAWITLGVFYTEFIQPDAFGTRETVRSGLYGLMVFILALLTQSVSRVMNTALSLASEQATRARRLQRFSQQALLDMPDGIIGCDPGHRILLLNERAADWFQLQQGDILPAALRMTGGQVQYHHNGLSLLLRKVPVGPAESGDYLLEIEDSARLAAEAQQIKLASLGRLTASIAHEIRNPLSALRQASQLLAETTYLQENERLLTSIIEQHCMRINRTIDDILQLSRRTQANTEALRLAPWLEHFANQFRLQHSLQNEQLSWHCDETLMVRFDPDQLQQILHNLCANGLRYAQRQQGDNARLHLVAVNAQGQQIQLDIMDNGGGVEAAQMPHLFEPFHTSEHNGTGLGLYLCRELCEANQARIQYHAIADGACFRIIMNRPDGIHP